MMSTILNKNQKIQLINKVDIIMAESELDRKIGKVLEVLSERPKKSKKNEKNGVQQQTQIGLILVFGFIAFVIFQIFGAVGLLMMPVIYWLCKHSGNSQNADNNYRRKTTTGKINRAFNDSVQNNDPCLSKIDYDPVSQTIYGDSSEDRR